MRGGECNCKTTVWPARVGNSDVPSEAAIKLASTCKSSNLGAARTDDTLVVMVAAIAAFATTLVHASITAAVGTVVGTMSLQISRHNKTAVKS